MHNAYNMDEYDVRNPDQILAALGYPGYGIDLAFDVIVEHRIHPDRSIEVIIDSMIDYAQIPH